MENFALLKKHLLLFDDNRKDYVKTIKSPVPRKAYADKIAECFIPCAKKILAGHFEVYNQVDGEKKVVRKIYPTVLELYYHEEGPGRFKDPIMYHTNDRKYYDYYLDANGKEKSHGPQSQHFFEKRGIKELPYYPVGSLNPHTSGIDITFENPDKGYRASCLIREYKIHFAEGKDLVPIKNSTDIYDDLLLFGITLDNADWIEWVDGTPSSTVLTQRERKNVSAYEKYNDSPELWRKVVIGHKADNKPIFAKCTFPWQFSKK